MRPCAVHAEGITCMQLPDAARSEQGCQGYLCLLKQPEPVAWPDRTALVAQVTLLGVSKDLEACGRLPLVHQGARAGVHHPHVQGRHLQQPVVQRVRAAERLHGQVHLGVRARQNSYLCFQAQRRKSAGGNVCRSVQYCTSRLPASRNTRECCNAPGIVSLL